MFVTVLAQLMHLAYASNWKSWCHEFVQVNVQKSPFEILTFFYSEKKTEKSVNWEDI